MNGEAKTIEGWRLGDVHVPAAEVSDSERVETPEPVVETVVPDNPAPTVIAPEAPVAEPASDEASNPPEAPVEEPVPVVEAKASVQKAEDRTTLFQRMARKPKKGVKKATAHRTRVRHKRTKTGERTVEVAEQAIPAAQSDQDKSFLSLVVSLGTLRAEELIREMRGWGES